MSELTLTNPVSFLVNRHGDPIDTSDAVGYVVKRWKGGRPALVRDEDNDPVEFPIDGTKRELCALVGYEPGVYRLYPCDENGAHVSDEIAQVELTPAEVGHGRPEDQYVHVLDRMMNMLEQSQEQCRSAMGMVCDVLRSQGTAMVDQQRATAEMVSVANETIRVANGVDALTRQVSPPKLDTRQLAAALAENLEMANGNDSKPEEGSFEKFMKSPWSKILASMVTGVGQPMIQLHQTRMKHAIEAEDREAAAAAKPAQRPTPTPTNSETTKSQTPPTEQGANP